MVRLAGRLEVFNTSGIESCRVSTVLAPTGRIGSGRVSSPQLVRATLIPPNLTRPAGRNWRSSSLTGRVGSGQNDCNAPRVRSGWIGSPCLVRVTLILPDPTRGQGLGLFELSRVESGLTKTILTPTGRVGKKSGWVTLIDSGQPDPTRSNPRAGYGGFQNLAGRDGSGQRFSFQRVGSGRVGSGYPDWFGSF